MYKCDRCGGMVDAGELTSGVCYDCWEEERALEIRSELLRQMHRRNIKEQPDGQLVLSYGR